MTVSGLWYASHMTPTDDQKLAALYWETHIRPATVRLEMPDEALAYMRKCYVRDVIDHDIEVVKAELRDIPHPALGENLELPTERSHVWSDQESTDDVIDGVDWVYCFSHRRAHTTGWCTVPKSSKIPLATRGEGASYYTAQDEARAMGLPIFEDTEDYWAGEVPSQR